MRSIIAREREREVSQVRVEDARVRQQWALLLLPLGVWGCVPEPGGLPGEDREASEGGRTEATATAGWAEGLSLLWSVGTAGMQTMLVQTSNLTLSAQSAQIMHSKVLAERERGGQWPLRWETDFVGNVEIEKSS